MKHKILLFLVAVFFVGGSQAVNAQDSMKKVKKDVVKKQKAVRFPDVQKSPTDISYMREGRRGPVTAKVVYSRPYKKGRVVFGELVPYGKVWRTGADEATEITFYKDVHFGGKKVKAGSYAVFTIPNEDSWEVILNTGLHNWGAFGYDAEKDVARVKTKVKNMNDSLENFSIVFNNGNMVMAWDKTMVAVSIEAK